MQMSVTGRLVFFLLTFLLFSLPFSGRAQKKKYPEKAYPEHFRLVFPKLIPYRSGDLWGYADSTGAIKIKPQYTRADPFEGKVAMVLKNTTVNLIDLTGKELFKWEHRYFSVWNNRLIFAETTNRLHGVYTIAGKEILPPVYRDATLLKYKETSPKALLKVWTDAKPEPGPAVASTMPPVYNMTIFDETGRQVLPELYEAVGYVGGGILQAYKDKTYFHFDDQGKRLPAFEGYRLSEYSNGVVLIWRDHKYGLADSTGKIIVKPQYDDAKEWREGKIAVKSNGRWGFIDKMGKELTPFKYAEPGYFLKGYAVAQTGRNA